MPNENSPRIKLMYRGLVAQTVWKPDLLNKIAQTASELATLIQLIDSEFYELFGEALEVPDDDEKAWIQTINVLVESSVPVEPMTVSIIDFVTVLQAAIAPNGTLDILQQHIKSNLDNISTNLGLVISWASEAQSMGFPDPSATLINDVFGLIRGDADARLTDCLNQIRQMTTLIQSNSNAIDSEAAAILAELSIISQKINSEKLALKGVIRQLSLAADAFAIQSSYDSPIGRSVLDQIVTTTADAILQMTDDDGTEGDDGPTEVGTPDTVISPPAPLSPPRIQPLQDYR